MEPGREDREHRHDAESHLLVSPMPQWNPAVKTGSTPILVISPAADHRASMEPGREDREHRRHLDPEVLRADDASMEPGREDREHPTEPSPLACCRTSLNGTRP